jgi:hypothetical protein
MKKFFALAPLAAAAVLFSAPAFAAAPLLEFGSNTPMLDPIAQPATTFVFDVSGINSNEGFGSPINEIRFLQVGANQTVIGIGWDVTLFADPPSWLSEMAVTFGSTSSPEILSLRPGIGVNSGGTQSFSSNGIINLVDLTFQFGVDADGLLRMEFWESFVDFPGDFDGIWQSGTLTIAVVPEPATYGLMALGLLGVAAAARRRRAD